MKRLLVLIAFCGTVQLVSAQSDVVEFLKVLNESKTDANLLFESYLKPYAYSLGDGLNNGWYNSAATHKLLGFDLSVSASAVMIPTSDKTFDLDNIGMTAFEASGSSSIAPTIAGENSSGPVITDKATGNISFNSPAGTGLDIVPVPVVQLTLGVLPHTDLMVRYVPTIDIDMEEDKASVDLFGIGVKHDFLKTIPGLKKLPLDASAFIGYSKIQAGTTISDSDGLSSGSTTVSFGDDGNQRLDITSKTLKYGLIVSKKLGPLTVWGSIAESSSKSTVDLKGDYTITTTITTTVNNTTYTEEESGTFSNPIDLNFETSNISFDAGLRFKLAFFSLFGSVSKSEYTSYNAGISLGFR